MTALAAVVAVVVGCLVGLRLWLSARAVEADAARRHEVAVYAAQAVRMQATTEDELREAVRGLEGRVAKMELARSMGGR